MESILKVLQEPTETMYKGLSQRAQYELSPQEVGTAIIELDHKIPVFMLSTC